MTIEEAETEIMIINNNINNNINIMHIKESSTRKYNGKSQQERTDKNKNKNKSDGENGKLIRPPHLPHMHQELHSGTLCDGSDENENNNDQKLKDGQNENENDQNLKDFEKKKNEKEKKLNNNN